MLTPALSTGAERVSLPPSGALQAGLAACRGAGIQRSEGICITAMGVRVSDNSNLFLYDSVTGRPLNTESFTDDNEIEAFLEWATETSETDLREIGVADELRGIWAEYLSEEWERMFYEPIFRGPECSLCGKPLGDEAIVHKACADYEAMRADLTPIGQ